MHDNDAPPWGELPTALLLQAIRAGSQPAMAALFSRWKSRSRGNANLLREATEHDTWLLEEAERETLKALWQSREAWLSLAAQGQPVVRGLFFEHVVAAIQRIVVRRYTVSAVHEPLTSDLSVIAAQLEVEVVDLRWALARQSPEDRQLVQAWVMGGTKREAARLLGLPYTTMVDRLARVVDKLRETLRD